MRVEKPETYNQPKLQNSFEQLQTFGQPRPDSVLNRTIPVVQATGIFSTKNDNMLPNESTENKASVEEFIISRTTLNFAKDREINQMVLRIKNERGEVIMQIPEEARLRLSRHIRKTYEENRKQIVDAAA